MGDPISILGLAAAAALRRARGVRLHPEWDAVTQVVADGARAQFRGFSTSVEHARARAEAIVPPPALVPGARIRSADLGGVPGEWVTPRRLEPDLTLLYFHGGGYVVGGPGTHRSVTGALATRCRARVFAPDYRRAPEQPHPAPLDDCVATYRALRAGGTAPDRIALVGDSAGGGLVLATLLTLRDEGDPLPRAAAAISPWTDLTASGGSIDANAAFDYLDGPLLRWFAAHHCQGADPRDPRISPGLGALGGLPPLLVHAGGAEILLDQIVAFAGRAEEAGVEVRLSVYPAMIHAWHLFAPLLPQAGVALGEIADFLRRPPGRV